MEADLPAAAAPLLRECLRPIAVLSCDDNWRVLARSVFSPPQMSAV